MQCEILLHRKSTIIAKEKKVPKESSSKDRLNAKAFFRNQYARRAEKLFVYRLLKYLRVL
jgi:hypothetical protein